MVTFNFRFQWFGNAQCLSPGRYQEVRLAEAREQVIKHRRAMFDGGDPQHLVGGSIEPALLGYNCNATI